MNKIHMLTLNSAVEEVVFAEGEDISHILRVVDSQEYLTGKAVNTAMLLSNLHVSCNMWVVCGRDTADRYRMLGNEFRTVNVLPVDGVTRRNQTYVLNGGKEYKIINKGYSLTEECVTAFYDRMRLEISRGDYLLVAGSLPDGMSAEWYARLIREMRGKGVTVLFDAGKSVLYPGVKGQPYYIKPNEEEVGEIVANFELKKAKHQLRELAENYKIENIVVTLGKRGAIGYDRATNEYVNVLSREIFSREAMTTGCGDSFNAGFIYGMITRSGFRQSMIYGVAFGGANIFAGFPEKVTMPIINERLRYIELDAM